MFPLVLDVDDALAILTAVAHRGIDVLAVAAAARRFTHYRRDGGTDDAFAADVAAITAELATLSTLLER